MDGTSIIPLQIAQTTHYSLTLYSHQGKHLGTLYKGMLERGEHKIQFIPNLFNLFSGTYILCLSNGKESIERTLIITN
ncbi:MAG TPA: hypothetical protein VEC36_07875 [Patescibacteria group bacterium]|nr:hypothetical protein [Patescibacteria group bacterium]